MPLTFTDEQYPLFRNSFDVRPTAATVAFETIDIQVPESTRLPPIAVVVLELVGLSPTGAEEHAA